MGNADFVEAISNCSPAARRSLAHALLIGALAGGFFVVGSAFVGPVSVAQDGLQYRKSFASITFVVGAANLWLALRDKRRIARQDD